MSAFILGTLSHTYPIQNKDRQDFLLLSMVLMP